MAVCHVVLSLQRVIIIRYQHGKQLRMGQGNDNTIDPETSSTSQYIYTNIVYTLLNIHVRDDVDPRVCNWPLTLITCQGCVYYLNGHMPSSCLKKTIIPISMKKYTYKQHFKV